MSALAFVNTLLETGRVRVPADPRQPGELEPAVRELDRAARPEMAFDPPPLDLAAAAWGLVVLYRGCQSLVYREIDADAVRDALTRPCPAKPSPEVCYSADLSLRYLPDLLALARGIAADDPLVAGLAGLARDWPLSSVGAKDVGVVDASAFISHPSLRQLYVDRIIERGDASRLDDAAVREAVRAALGGFPELAPRIAPAVGAAGRSVE